jgi:hypothetical protein
MHKSIDQRLAALEALEREQEVAQPPDVAEIAALSDEEVLSEAIHCAYTHQFLWRDGRPVQPYHHTTEGGAWAHGIAERVNAWRERTGMVFVPLWREDATAALSMIEQGELALFHPNWGVLPIGLYGKPRWAEVFRVGSAVNHAQVAVLHQTGGEPVPDTAAMAAWLRSLLGDDDEND